MTRTSLEREQPQLPDTELRLPRPPGVFRRWLSSHTRAVDWVIVSVYLFGCALMVSIELLGQIAMVTLADASPVAAEQMRGDAQVFGWQWVLLTLCAVAVPAVALRFRRRFPVQGVVLLSLLTFFGQGLLAFPNFVALIFLIYAAPVHRSVVAGWVAYGIAVTAHTTLFLLGSDTGMGLFGVGALTESNALLSADAVMISVLNAMLLLAVLMTGINRGNRQRYVEALIARARQLARDREQQAQLAAAAERSRIVREMHDIVAHSLSVVVTLSEAAAVTMEQSPEAAKQAMERASETGRGALVEMRRLLGVLQDPDPVEPGAEGYAPQPGIAQLPQLVEGFREAGLAVRLSQQGQPADDTGHQLTVYRIVQEALTNTLRYAGPGARVDAEIEYTEGMCAVTVTDDGPPRATQGEPGPGLTGSGLGIAGARQRAQVFGGALEAGMHGNGWRLYAEVPVETTGGRE